MQDACTAKELMPLLGLKSVSSVLRRAQREDWHKVVRAKKLGGDLYPLNSMPTETQKAIAQAMLQASVPALREAAPAPAAAEEARELERLPHCTDRQRASALARLALLQEVKRIAPVTGKNAAILHLIQCTEDGTLAPELLALVPKANDRLRRGTVGLSRRQMYQWLADYEKGGLAGLVPGKREKDMRIPKWLPVFLPYYQKPQKPTLALAYSDFTFAWAEMKQGKPPSITCVRSFLKKIALPELEAGRKTGNALLKVQPYLQRTTGHMIPGDVYTADGTTFDAEIQHPYTGRPFKPEITAVIDVATRRLVGMSVSLAESAFAILDALRMACVFAGIPAVFYTDNGSGYRNSLMQAEAVGMLARLGITEAKSIPGRPQGKGLMERAVKTLCTNAAKRLPSCMHADMDTDTGQKVFKLTRAHLKNFGKSPLLPTWEDFKAAMLQRIEEYNNTPHRALPKMIDEALGRRRHMSPNEMWQHLTETHNVRPKLVPKDMQDELFMPSERRVVRNAMVSFYNGKYFAPELADFHGDTVEVRYDIWDSAQVYIYAANGRKICTAKLDGNAIPYFTPSRIEAAQQKRERAQLKRLEAKAEAIAPGARLELPEAEPEYTLMADCLFQPVREKEALTLDAPVAALPQAEPEPERRPMFTSRTERYTWLMRHPDRRTADDAVWLADYAQSAEYIDLEEYYGVRGLAWTGTAGN